MELKQWAKTKDHPKQKEARKALKYLNQFTEEYTNASFNKHATPIQRKKAHRKDAYDRNNARNRCMYTKAKMTAGLEYMEDLKIRGEDIETNDYEEYLINKIDGFDDSEDSGSQSD